MKKFLLLGLLLGSVANAQMSGSHDMPMNMDHEMMMPIYFMASLDGMSEKPNMVETKAMGEVMAVLHGNMLWISGEFMDLSSQAVAAHIHGPADMNVTAGVIVPLAITQDTKGVLGGAFMLTDEQVKQLTDGMMYINIHTKNNPGGEIRGQLMMPMMKMHAMK